LTQYQYDYEYTTLILHYQKPPHNGFNEAGLELIVRTILKVYINLVLALRTKTKTVRVAVAE